MTRQHITLRKQVQRKIVHNNTEQYKKKDISLTCKHKTEI